MLCRGVQCCIGVNSGTLLYSSEQCCKGVYSAVYWCTVLCRGVQCCIGVYSIVKGCAAQCSAM